MRSIDLDPVRLPLKILINNALNISAESVLAKAVKTPEEPDFVASLAVDFTPNLFNILSSAFPRFTFSVSGVFVHQSPIVEFDKNQTCELGDLLVVYTYTNENKKTFYNSLLLQAKRTNQPWFKLDPNDSQYCLYSSWPLFKCKKGPKNISRRPFDIIPKLPSRGGQYLLINDHPFLEYGNHSGIFAFGTGLAIRKLHVEKEFSDELLDLFSFQSGRLFESDPRTTKDEWTRLIWELLYSTQNIVSRRVNIGLTAKKGSNSLPRNTFRQNCSNGMRSSIFENLGAGDTIKNDDEGISDFEDNYGPSVILVECNDFIE